MKRLVLALCVAALAAPVAADAKGVLGVELCGSSGCGTEKHAFGDEGGAGAFQNLGAVVQPAAPGPWYRGALLVGEPNGKVFGRIPFFYVPAGNLMVEPGSAGRQPAWWHPQGKVRRTVEALAAQIEPYGPPASIDVRVDGRRVDDPQSYLRLYTLGSKTDTYPVEDGYLELRFRSPRRTPWTTGNYMVVYPKSHLLVRDGQIVSIPAATAARVASARSLAAGDGGLPWVQLAVGVGILAAMGVALARLRPRGAPQPVPHT